MTKVDKQKLMEVLRDTIFEVIEEEIDRKIQEMKNRKQNEHKATRVKGFLEKIDLRPEHLYSKKFGYKIQLLSPVELMIWISWK